MSTPVLERLQRKMHAPRLKLLRKKDPSTKKPRGSVATRIIFGAAVATVSLSFVWMGGTVLMCFALAICAVAQREFYSLARASGVVPNVGIGVTAGAVVIMANALLPEPEARGMVGWAILGSFLAFILMSRKRTFTMGDVAVTILGFVYVVWGFAQILQLRKMSGDMQFMGLTVTAGLFYTWMLCWTTAWSDIGCFAWGKAFGKHPLCPWISPNKTLEGAIGGVLTAMLIASLWCLTTTTIPISTGLAMGFLGSIAAQLGDLWESYLKRDAGVKDAGSLIPGHGGLLDRFDSFFFSTPVIFALVKLLTHTW